MSGLRWVWRDAALGVAYAVPAAVMVPFDLGRAIALAIGVLPAAIIGLPATRRGRLKIVVLGVMTGVPLLLGSVASASEWSAIVVLLAGAIGATWLARTRAVGAIVLALSLPMVAVGLSYDDVAEGAGLAAIMIAGSAYACAVSMLWPAGEPEPKPPPDSTTVPTFGFGVRLGCAAALAVSIGYALDLAHIGWATAAVVLVMKPDRTKTLSRMVGRLVSVALGGAVAVLIAAAGSAEIVYAVAVVTAVAGASATHTSRWYVTSGFTTFLVLLLLVSPTPGDAGFRYAERLSETFLGVALAFLFGVAIPAVTGRLTPRSAYPTEDGHFQDGPLEHTHPENRSHENKALENAYRPVNGVRARRQPPMQP